MINILLLYLNPIDWASVAAPPYGLEILAASVADLPVSVSIENPFLSEEPIKFVSSLLSMKTYDIIGLSIRNLDNMAHVWEMQGDGSDSINSRCFLDDILPVVDIINKTYKGLILCGGAGFSIAPIELLRLFGLRYGVCGPGEETFRILVKEMIDNNNIDSYIAANYKNLPGMVFENNSDSQVVSNLIQPKVQYRHLAYNSEWIGHVPVRISYGCNGQCVYCVERNSKNGVLFRSVDEVVSEIECVGKQGKSIWLVCSEANMPNEEYIIKLCDVLAERNIKNQLTSYFVPKNFTQAMYEKLICAGFTSQSICLGITHISNIILEKNKILYQKKDIDKTLDIFYNNKAESVTLGVILGLEGENEKTLSELAEWIVQTSKKFGVGFRCFINSGVRIYPNTPLSMKINDSDFSLKLYGQTPPFDLLRPLVYCCYETPRIILEKFLHMTKEAKGIVTAYNKGNTIMQDDKEVFINYQKAMLNKSIKEYDLADKYLEAAYHKATLHENKRIITLEKMKLRSFLRNRSKQI